MEPQGGRLRTAGPWGVASAATMLLLVALWVGINVGSEPTSLRRALNDPASLDRVLIMEARLPRVLLGAVAGGGLATTGAAFQALLRNPLAEPYVLGVSGGAALGASVAIALGASALTTLGVAVVPAAALAGGLGATMLVYLIARRNRSPSGATWLLAGVIVNALASALITFLKTLVSAARAQELLFWLMGFLDVPTATTLSAVALCSVAGSVALYLDAGRLHLLALGNEPAAHVGVDVPALERRVFFFCSLVVGAIVSVTGLIGFVGLVVPQGLRKLLGPDPRTLLPLSFLLGAALLVLCDAAGRLTFRVLGTEPPVGALTALLGGPLFLVLLARRRP
ncbi:MAG: iron ABC transporter permease [Myxococcales bacterium]|nr:iron ABC transporter permease [Myxococcales bacterium]